MCDEAFNWLMPYLKKIYEKYSGANNLPGTTKYMSLDEFFWLINGCQVVNDNFGQWEIGTIFNLSIQTSFKSTFCKLQLKFS